jgi:hypothetical protein
MTYADMQKYFEKRVMITTLEDEVFVGTVTGFDDALDTDSGNDEVELFIEKYFVCIEIPDVKSVKILD